MDWIIKAFIYFLFRIFINMAIGIHIYKKKTSFVIYCDLVYVGY